MTAARRSNGPGTVALEFLRAVAQAKAGEEIPPGSSSAMDDLRDLMGRYDLLRKAARGAADNLVAALGKESGR